MGFGDFLSGAGDVFMNTITLGGYGAMQAGEAQASAARYAADRNAAAQEYSADRAADASERSAQLQADAMIRASQMQSNMQRQMMEMQRDIFRRQMLQAERFSVRDELRYVAGKAATDTFNKVAGTATTLWEINDIAREQRLIEQFGLNDDPALQAPPVAPSSWEASNYDLLTGARVSDSNPYA
ncbi:MAG: hypothetical protein HYW02_07015, partial [Deltaproteobacteria bacterium]|nr:hypothetical protein [Deltaproteobacteria bacterium]